MIDIFQQELENLPNPRLLVLTDKWYCFTRIQNFQEMVGYLHMKLDIAWEEDI